MFQALPAAAHNIKVTASKFLLGWLLEHEHEHRQWTAGISLGLISSSLHVTDHKEKFQNISGLLEVLTSFDTDELILGNCYSVLVYGKRILSSKFEEYAYVESVLVFLLTLFLFTLKYACS